MKVEWGKVAIYMVIAVCVVVVCVGIYLATRHRTEAIFERNRLVAIQDMNDVDVQSIYLKWRWAESKSGYSGIDTTLTNPKDQDDIVALMRSIRNDLWVEHSELNPNGTEPPPVYDDVQVKTNKGEVLYLPCWFGKEGGDNPSLSLRSRNGDFKRIVQDIMKRKGRPMTKRR